MFETTIPPLPHIDSDPLTGNDSNQTLTQPTWQQIPNTKELETSDSSAPLPATSESFLKLCGIPQKGKGSEANQELKLAPHALTVCHNLKQFGHSFSIQYRIVCSDVPSPVLPERFSITSPNILLVPSSEWNQQTKEEVLSAWRSLDVTSSLFENDPSLEARNRFAEAIFDASRVPSLPEEGKVPISPYLIREGIPKLLPENVTDDQYVGLVSFFVELAEMNPHSAEYVAGYISSRLETIFGDKVVYYSDALRTLTKATGERSFSLFDRGLRDIFESLGEEEFFSSWGDIISFIENQGPKAPLLLTALSECQQELSGDTPEKLALFERIGRKLSLGEISSIGGSIYEVSKSLGEVFTVSEEAIEGLILSNPERANEILRDGIRELAPYITSREELLCFIGDIDHVLKNNPQCEMEALVKGAAIFLDKNLSLSFEEIWSVIVKFAADPATGDSLKYGMEGIPKISPYVTSVAELLRFGRDLIAVTEACKEDGHFFTYRLEKIQSVFGEKFLDRWDTIVQMVSTAGRHGSEMGDFLASPLEEIRHLLLEERYWGAFHECATIGGIWSGFYLNQTLSTFYQHGMIQEPGDVLRLGRELFELTAQVNDKSFLYHRVSSIAKSLGQEFRKEWPEYLQLLALAPQDNRGIDGAYCTLVDAYGTDSLKRLKAPMQEIVSRAPESASTILSVHFRRFLDAAPDLSVTEVANNLAMIAERSPREIWHAGGVSELIDAAGPHLKDLHEAIVEYSLELGRYVGISKVFSREHVLRFLNTSDKPMPDQVAAAAENLRTLAYCAKPITHYLHESGVAVAMLEHLFTLKTDPYRLRALFEVYFQPDEESKCENPKQGIEEVHRSYIDRLSLERAKVSQYAFFDKIPPSLLAIHQKSERKLPLQFLPVFLAYFVEEDTTIRANHLAPIRGSNGAQQEVTLPTAELFYKLFACGNRLREWQLLVERNQEEGERLLALKGDSERKRELLTQAFRVIDGQYGLSALSTKKLSKEKLHRGVAVGPAYDIARDVERWFETVREIVTVENSERVVELLKPNINAIEVGMKLHIEATNSEERQKAFNVLTTEVNLFKLRFRDVKFELVWKEFESFASADPTIREEQRSNFRDFLKSSKRDVFERSLLDRVEEFLNTNHTHDEVKRNLFEDLEALVEGRFQDRRYSAWNYQWLWKQHGEFLRNQGQDETSVIDRVRTIQRAWEENKYYKVYCPAAKKYLYLGFTDNFQVGINIGNNPSFGSCQATYKPSYNQGLSGTLSSGWNKFLVAFDGKGNFLGRHILRIRGEQEPSLIRERLYGDLTVEVAPEVSLHLGTLTELVSS